MTFPSTPHAVDSYNGKNSYKGNSLSFLYFFLLFSIIVLPAEILPAYFEYVIFGLICAFPIILNTSTSRAIYCSVFYLFIPIMFLLIIVVLSHAKGVFLGINLSVNDFSDYLKFFMPMLVALGAYQVCDIGSRQRLRSAIRCASLVYTVFFIIYLVSGVNFIYSIGLGRGSSEYYRYGGLDSNPNAYASIAVALLFYLFFTVRKSEYKIIFMMACLFLSVVLSQSRTALIALVVVFFAGFFLMRVSKQKKIIFIFSVFALVIFSVNYFDLYWLMQPGRFDVLSDNSFLTRVSRSLTTLDANFIDVGALGIGPAKSEIDRLDTISYILYYVRYGVLGLFLFVSAHVWLSLYFYFKYKKYRLNRVLSEHNRIFLMNCLFPIYVLIVNISNEKWIDIKFLVLWFVMIGVGGYSVKVVKLESRRIG